jgi:hypothetical protein
VPVSAAAAVPSTKPFGVGLFTSTGNALSPHGMWRLYLDGWTVARHVWAIDTNGRPAVCEITTAAEWVEFVLTHPPLRPSTPVSLPLTAPPPTSTAAHPTSRSRSTPDAVAAIAGASPAARPCGGTCASWTRRCSRGCGASF